MSDLLVRRAGDWRFRKDDTVFGSTSPPPSPPPSSGGDPAFATMSQIGSLSITSAAALRVKGNADNVKNGTFVAGVGTAHDWNHVDSKCGALALSVALWWARTGDSTYLGPLQTYLRNVIKSAKATNGRALDPMRQAGGVLAAVDILRKYGQWDDNFTLPNHSGDTFRKFLLGGGVYADTFQVRPLTGNATERWAKIRAIPTANTSTMDDSASNWGATARFSQVMWAVNAQALDATLTEGLAHAVNRMKKLLGDQTTGLPDFKGTGNYLNSWDNWTVQASGSNQPLKAGVGKTDAANPGLDGVIINDIDRGVTNYDPAVTFYGATGSGLTYPLENTDYVWAVAAVLMNLGYPVRTWGEGGNAFDRMNARLARVRSGDTQSLFDYTENASAVYAGGRAIAAQLSRTSYGTIGANPSGLGGTSRAMPNGDWLGGAGSTWGQP